MEKNHPEILTTTQASIVERTRNTPLPSTTRHPSGLLFVFAVTATALCTHTKDNRSRMDGCEREGKLNLRAEGNCFIFYCEKSFLAPGNFKLHPSNTSALTKFHYYLFNNRSLTRQHLTLSRRKAICCLFPSWFLWKINNLEGESMTMSMILKVARLLSLYPSQILAQIDRNLRKHKCFMNFKGTIVNLIESRGQPAIISRVYAHVS